MPHMLASLIPKKHNQSRRAQFLWFIRTNHLELFPNLLDQSQFNRRARRLSGLFAQSVATVLGERIGSPV